MNDRRCPACGEPLKLEAIHAAEQVALCLNCGELSRLSDINACGQTTKAALLPIPKGCTVVDQGLEIVASASFRSLPNVVTATFLCLFWNGIVSVFVIFAIAGLYKTSDRTGT